MPTVLKSGSLNHLEPSGPVPACNGIALSLPVNVSDINHNKEKQVKLPLIKLPSNFSVQNLKISNIFTEYKKMYKHDFQSENYPGLKTNTYK